jgi:hypothetical protein
MPKEATQFRKGNKGGGRPKGFRGVAKLIMEETRDGAELVEYALEVFRDQEGKRMPAQRWEALQWLSDRGLGKPLVSVDLAAEVGVTLEGPVALAEMSDAELHALVATLPGVLPAVDEPAMLTVTSTEVSSSAVLPPAPVIEVVIE